MRRSSNASLGCDDGRQVWRPGGSRLDSCRRRSFADGGSVIRCAVVLGGVIVVRLVVIAVTVVRQSRLLNQIGMQAGRMGDAVNDAFDLCARKAASEQRNGECTRADEIFRQHRSRIMCPRVGGGKSGVAR